MTSVGLADSLIGLAAAPGLLALKRKNIFSGTFFEMLICCNIEKGFAIRIRINNATLLKKIFLQLYF